MYIYFFLLFIDLTLFARTFAKVFAQNNSRKVIVGNRRPYETWLAALRAIVFANAFANAFADALANTFANGRADAFAEGLAKRVAEGYVIDIF